MKEDLKNKQKEMSLYKENKIIFGRYWVPMS